MAKNKAYKYLILLMIFTACVIRLMVAVKTSIASSKIGLMKNDENRVLEENRKLKEVAYGNSVVSLEEKAHALQYLFPKKILYLKTPENIAGL